MKLKYLIAFLGLSLGLYSCSDDDKTTPGTGTGTGTGTNNTSNLNQNKLAEGEPVYAQNYEIPHLKGGNSTFIYHTVATYGLNFCVEWDCGKKSQRWTAYQMYATNNVTNWNRSNWYSTEWGGDPFQEDLFLPAEYRTVLSDYRGSGYDRGHICPSADRLNSREANEQTFYLSNMQPQMNGFNAGLWSNMEAQVRKWNVDNFRDTLYVCKGGTIDSDDQILAHTTSGLIVPKYFFMAILCRYAQGYKALAFWAEHKKSADSSKLADYVISIDELEARTGIDFFCNLPDAVENSVEANTYPSAWNLK